MEEEEKEDAFKKYLTGEIKNWRHNANNGYHHAVIVAEALQDAKNQYIKIKLKKQNV